MATNSLSRPYIYPLTDRQSQRHSITDRLMAKSRHYPRFTVPPLTPAKHQRGRAIAESVLARMLTPAY